jgi:hypothetical protein
MEGKKEDSLQGYNVVGFYVDERSSLQEGGAHHQPMVSPPSYKLAAEAGERTAYHFYPCALSKVVAGFHHGVDRRNLLEYGNFFSRNRFRFHRADNANNTRSL